MVYLNFDVTPGITKKLFFEVLDDTGRKKDLTGYNLVLQVFDKRQEIMFTNTVFQIGIKGVASAILSGEQTLIFEEGYYKYRLVATDPQGNTEVLYKGFVAASPPNYLEGQTALGTSITLPNGVIYPTSALVIAGETWYAISSVYRFLVSGSAVMVLDGMDIRGTVFPNVSVFINQAISEISWVPDLSGLTAFRIKIINGSPVIRYLP